MRMHLEDLKYYLLQAIAAIIPKSLIGLVVAAFAPLATVFWAFMIAFTVDFILGVTHSIKRGTFNSSGMRRGLFKLFVYMSFVGTVAVIERAVLGNDEAGWLARAALALCAFTELLSIIEHCVMLGVPVPGSALVLMWAKKKSELYGISYAVKGNDHISVVRDITGLVEACQDYKHNTVKTVMTSYLLEWQDWVRKQREEDFTATSDLLWERMKNQVDGVLMEARDHMLTKRVNPRFVELFYKSWTRELFKHFNSKLKVACYANVPVEDKLKQVHDALGLMLYRLSAAVRILDAQGGDPFETHPDTVIKPAAGAGDPNASDRGTGMFKKS